MSLQDDLNREINRLKFIIENLYTAIGASSVILFDNNINTIAECGGIDTEIIEKAVRDLIIQAQNTLSLIDIEQEKKILILEAGSLGLYASPVDKNFILMAIVQKNIEIETRKDAIYNAVVSIKKITSNLVKYATATDLEEL